MYSCGPPHMANQKQDGQLEHTYSSSVMIRDVTLKTCQRRWMIGKHGERGSGISVLAARHDDDDDIYIKLILHYIKHNKILLYLVQCYKRETDIIVHYLLPHTIVLFSYYYKRLFGWTTWNCLFVWSLWNINFCRLYDTKSIVIINSSISNNSVLHKYAVYILKQFYIHQFSLA